MKKDELKKFNDAVTIQFKEKKLQHLLRIASVLIDFVVKNKKQKLSFFMRFSFIEEHIREIAQQKTTTNNLYGQIAEDVFKQKQQGQWLNNLSKETKSFFKGVAEKI